MLENVIALLIVSHDTYVFQHLNMMQKGKTKYKNSFNIRAVCVGSVNHLNSTLSFTTQSVLFGITKVKNKFNINELN